MARHLRKSKNKKTAEQVEQVTDRLCYLITAAVSHSYSQTVFPPTAAAAAAAASGVRGRDCNQMVIQL